VSTKCDISYGAHTLECQLTKPPPLCSGQDNRSSLGHFQFFLKIYDPRHPLGSSETLHLQIRNLNIISPLSDDLSIPLISHHLLVRPSLSSSWGFLSCKSTSAHFRRKCTSLKRPSRVRLYRESENVIQRTGSDEDMGMF